MSAPVQGHGAARSSQGAAGDRPLAPAREAGR